MMAQHKNFKHSSNPVNFPPTKLKNIFCTHCKHQFFLQEFLPLRGVIPVLLKCGHVICDKCEKSCSDKPCPLCNMVSNSTKDQTHACLLNIYALGLIVMSYNRPIDDSDISFPNPHNSKTEESFSGLCHECGVHADVKCRQCVALYCHNCYQKIHRRALQNHMKVLLRKSDEKSFIIKNICSDTCSEPLGYYCETCDVAGCSHCMLCMHSQHKYQPLQRKNEELMTDFAEAFQRVWENHYRIQQSQKKLNEILSKPSEMQDVMENVEWKVTQHFGHLHGVLQNIETKIINSIREHRIACNKNIEEISMALKQHEERLHSALLLAAQIKNYLDKIDVKQIIGQLETLSKIPCYLVQNSAPKESFTFEHDNSIIEALEKHCTIHVPEIYSYSLNQTDALPEDYDLEPYVSNFDVSISKQSEKSTVTSKGTRTDHSPTVGTTEMVRVSYVVDPSCFYVQLVQNQNRILDITKRIGVLAETTATTPTEITINGLYIVQYSENLNWYRARVIDKKILENGEERYTVTIIDYGTREENVPLERIKNISPESAITPVMALKCSLHDIVPNNGKWHPEAIRIFKDLVCTNFMVSMHIVHNTGDTYYVDLCGVSLKDSGLISVKESLIYMKYGTCATPNKLMKVNSDRAEQYYHEQLDMEKYTKVNVLYVESPSAIFVEKAFGSRPYLCSLIRELSKECDEDTLCNLTSIPNRGMPCAARRSDGYWYRGLIKEVTENAAQVFFVDLGYTINVEYANIKSLDTKYLTCAMQAIKVSLRSIKPKNRGNEWHPEAIDFVRDLTLTKTCRIIPFEKLGNTYSVTMYVNENTNVANALLKHHLAMQTGSGTKAKNDKTKRDKRNDRLLENTTEKCIELNNNDQSFYAEATESSTKTKRSVDNEDPFKINVQIHQVQSPDCIYVSDLTCDQEDVEQMMKQMQEFYTKFRSARNDWGIDSVCTVYSEKSDMYYRARIIDIKSDDKVIVFLYDIGIEETVTMDNIQSLYPFFAHTPTHVFKIKLTGILPCGGSDTWPSFSCQKLCEIINNNTNCKFFISKVNEEDAEDDAIPVELWIKQLMIDGPLSPTRYEINSVNRLLVEHGVALPIKEYAKKRDKILAIELKRQLSKKIEHLSKSESNLNWFGMNGDVQALSALEAFITNTTGNTVANLQEETDGDEQDFTDILDKLPSFPKLKSWLPAVPIENDVFIAVPTYIDDEGFIYLHSLRQNSDLLDYIEKNLERLYKEPPIESCDSVWNVGDLCIAQYHTNKKWYRGKVIDTQGNDMIKVEFVDYGNVEECSIGTLKKKVILENIPVQCTKCVVYGLQPENGKWLTKDLDRIHNIIVDQKCKITVIERTETHLLISLEVLPNKYRNTQIDLIEYLINNLKMNIKPMTSIEQIALVRHTPSANDTIDEFMENRSISSDEEVIESIITENPSPDSFTNTDKSDSSSTVENFPLLFSSTPCTGSQETLLDKYITLIVPKDVDYIEIEMSCSVTATDFFAKLGENIHSPVLNSYFRNYQLLMMELQEEASKQPMIKTFSPHTPCCGKFSDDVWYRCVIRESKIDEHSNKIIVNLFYVDYGNDEYRRIDPQQCELYALKKEWLNVPPMSMRCKLWNIEVAPTIDVRNRDIETELEKFYNVPIVAVIKESKENFKIVELYENNKCEKFLFDDLIKKGFLLRKKKIN